MFICEIWLFNWYFPQFFKYDMSKYRYLEVFHRVPSTSRSRESTVVILVGWGWTSSCVAWSFEVQLVGFFYSGISVMLFDS